MILLYLATVITLIMLVWFKTDFMVDWFGVKEKEFNKEKINWLPATLSFPTFMKITYPSFWTKLLGCPLCVSFWLSVLFCSPACLFNPLFMIFVPPLCILSLFIYGVITKLVNIS